MASANVIEWIEKYRKFIGAQVLEVGSKVHHPHSSLGLRDLLEKKLPRSRIIGCDLSPGIGVDVVVDITSSSRLLKSAFEDKQFDTVFCVSVLEHVPNIFDACRNISTLLKTGGSLFVSVPFVFRYHGYPGDMWRFTPEAVAHLFPEIDFLDCKYSNVSSLIKGDVMSLKSGAVEKINRFAYRPKSREDVLDRKKQKASGGPVVAYALAPTMINMLGVKK